MVYFEYTSHKVYKYIKYTTRISSCMVWICRLIILTHKQRLVCRSACHVDMQSAHVLVINIRLHWENCAYLLGIQWTRTAVLLCVLYVNIIKMNAMLICCKPYKSFLLIMSWESSNQLWWGWLHLQVGIVFENPHASWPSPSLSDFSIVGIQ